MPRRITHIEFVERVKTLVGNEYEVTGEFDKINAPVRMRHVSCGYEWYANAGCFIGVKTSRCPKCANLSREKHLSPKITFEEYSKVFKEISNGEYELISDFYVDNKTKLEVKHLSCGSYYWVRPNDFQQGYRCPGCNRKTSHSHKEVGRILSSMGVRFYEEQTFDGCHLKGDLKFDFWIPDISVLIEYDGEQHFIPAFGKNKEEKLANLRKVQEIDKKKEEWVNDHDVLLYRIPFIYWESLSYILVSIVKERSTTIEGVIVRGGQLR
jgi:hypothetical protein